MKVKPNSLFMTKKDLKDYMKRKKYINEGLRKV